MCTSVRACVCVCVCVCVGVVVYSECFQKYSKLESSRSIWIFYNALIVRNWFLTVFFFFFWHLVTLWLVVILSKWKRTLNTCIQEFTKRSWLMAILKRDLLQPFQKSQSYNYRSHIKVSCVKVCVKSDCFVGTGFSLEGIKTVLELDKIVAAHHCECTKCNWIVNCKTVNFCYTLTQAKV